MSYQEVFNIVLGIAAFLASWWLKVLWETIKDLQTNNQRTIEQLKNTELLIIGNYITKDEFIKNLDKVFAKLDKIEEKLDLKADKQK